MIRGGQVIFQELWYNFVRSYSIFELWMSEFLLRLGPEVQYFILKFELCVVQFVVFAVV
jgi:hypothetical protein